MALFSSSIQKSVSLVHSPPWDRMYSCASQMNGRGTHAVAVHEPHAERKPRAQAARLVARADRELRVLDDGRRRR